MHEHGGPGENIRTLIRGIAVAACVSILAACASNPNEPGSDLWYTHRIEEIEAAKSAGQISEAEYLSLKNQADATRALRLNAVRYGNDYDGIFGPW